MHNYLALLRRLLEEGTPRGDRTGTGTRSLFGTQMRFDLGEGFPAVTTKRLHFKSVAHELLWFLRGEPHIGYLEEHGVTIWDEWADEEGQLGPIYGVQWRSWPRPEGGEVDQIRNVIDAIKTNPESRRHVVSAWNPGQLEAMALPPCHVLFQFYVADGALSCQLYQRSGDIFLGVPFNIASYALLTHMVAQVCDLEVGEFVHVMGDAHLYENHVEQARTQLERQPFEKPRLVLDDSVDDIDGFRYEHIHLEDYQCHPTIRAPVAV